MMTENDRSRRVDPTTLDGIYDDLYTVMITIQDAEAEVARAQRQIIALLEKLQQALPPASTDTEEAPRG